MERQFASIECLMVVGLFVFQRNDWIHPHRFSGGDVGRPGGGEKQERRDAPPRVTCSMPGR
jgi:hypothetical protein